MLITHKEQVASYKPHIWFDPKSITNLAALKNLIKHYCVAYNILDKISIVHKEEHGNHNMNFIINYSGLYYYDPEDKDFLFVRTVAGNK